VIFRPSTVSALWDTWILHDAGTWHLFYLVTERGLGEGIGLATSPDGVHFTDQGPVLRQSREALWLGTGSTWRAPGNGSDQPYVMNFSEWIGRDQVIRFAESTDLRAWTRLPDLDFPVDGRWYASTRPRWGFLFAPRSMLLMYAALGLGVVGRWDSIHAVPRDDGGFWGFWTATPRGRPGFGFGRSDDGRRWEALPPPAIDWGTLPPPPDAELGAVERIGDRWFALVGSVSNRGMLALFADRPEGPWRLAPRNSLVLGSGSLRLNTYYARFCRAPDGSVLAHHHSICRRLTRRLRPVCALAPLKRALPDTDGTLRLAWWEGNDALRGEPLPFDPAGTSFDPARGAILDADVGTRAAGTTIVVGEDRGATRLHVRAGGVVTIASAAGRVLERIDRCLPLRDRCAARLLVRDGLLELYVDGFLAQAYSLPGGTAARIAIVPGEGEAPGADAAMFAMTF
jgi:hypothetical protein